MKTILRKIIVYVLQIESRLVLYKYKPKIVAITGSIGKTSTKDAIYAVLSKFAYVRKSQKSFNSEIGLPLTILGIPNGWNNPIVWILNILKGLWLFVGPHKYPSWLVLEVGVGKPGDMRRTASWLKTDAVVITGIGYMPAHIEFFNSRKHLIEEKSQLIKTLKKGGLLILNGDDEDVLAMKTKTKQRVATYGFREGVDVRGSGDSILYDEEDIPKGVIFRVDEEGRSLPVTIEGVFGKNHVYASLCALTFASQLGFNMLTATDSLVRYDIPPGRMRLLRGIQNSLIIDDTYNSSPFACESALKTLGNIKQKTNQENLTTHAGRKIAILGDMLELGRHTLEAHKHIGNVAKENINILVVVGHRAMAIKEGALETGMNEQNIFEFSNSREAGEFIKTFIDKGDIVLIKGSQGVRMERVTEAILFDQKNKDKLLVRQDTEWKNRK